MFFTCLLSFCCYLMTKLTSWIDAPANSNAAVHRRRSLMSNKKLARQTSRYSLQCFIEIARQDSIMLLSQRNLERLMSDLVDVNMADGKGNTVLHIFVDYCLDKETFQYKTVIMDSITSLIARGADVNKANNKGLTPVHLASQLFLTRVLEIFAQNGADFERRTLDKETPLHLACKFSLLWRDKSKMKETVDFLISQDCDLEAYDKKGYMALHYAAQFGKDECVQSFIETGANVNCQMKAKRLSPLHLAAANNHLHLVRQLVEAGANVNAEALHAVTPVFMSALNSSLQCLQYLYDQGADLHHRETLNGFTLLHYVASGNHKLVFADESKYKMIFLVQMAIDIDDAGSRGVTPLHMASIFGNVPALETLIKLGANVNFQNDSFQFNALHLAAMHKYAQVSEILINAGAHIDSPSGLERQTPLHLALTIDQTPSLQRYVNNIKSYHCRDNNNYPIQFSGWSYCPHYTLQPDENSTIKILLKYGADVNAIDACGLSPLRYAIRRKGTYHQTKTLLQAGARPNAHDHKSRSALLDALINQQDKTLQLLLDFAADINDDEFKQEIVKSKSKYQTMASLHAIKLKTLGWHIDGVYESLISSLGFEDFRVQCFRELNRLKKHRVDNFTIYEFLHMNFKRQYLHAQEISDLFDILQSLYPLYFGIIRGACRESIIRHSLLKTARIVWFQVTNIYLPDVCVENVLIHLSNAYLETFVKNRIATA